jgi:formylglycine-generating enzyme required for sulfatase activity
VLFLFVYLIAPRLVPLPMKNYLAIFSLLAIVVAVSCRSSAPEDLSAYSFAEHTTPPGMILIEGGIYTFTKPGRTSATEKVRAFYISEAEETNSQYLAYLGWLKKRFSYSTYAKALPDTTVWLRENFPDSIRQFLVRNYLRHFAYSSFPVVGLTPEQIEKYCEWKSDRLNEMMMISQGIIEPNPDENDSVDYFTLAPYRSSWHDTLVIKRSRPAGKKEKQVVGRMEDDRTLPPYRIPSPGEWKVAALALSDKDDTYIRTPRPMKDKRDQFSHLYGGIGIVSNYTGMPMYLDEAGTKPVHWAKMNNYRLYGMNGNVSELVKQGSSYSLIGGSWKRPAGNYSVRYDNTIADSLRYVVTDTFYVNTSREEIVSAAAGFRVAMTCKGAGYGKIYGKRRKARP